MKAVLNFHINSLNINLHLMFYLVSEHFLHRFGTHLFRRFRSDKPGQK